MDFRVLGPLEVLGADGRALTLGGPKQRAVLAALLVRANERLRLTSSSMPCGVKIHRRALCRLSRCTCRVFVARSARELRGLRSRKEPGDTSFGRLLR